MPLTSEVLEYCSMNVGKKDNQVDKFILYGFVLKRVECHSAFHSISSLV
jgi:hypothetical protein